MDGDLRNACLSYMAQNQSFQILEEYEHVDSDETCFSELHNQKWSFKVTASTDYGIQEHQIGLKGMYFCQ